MSSHVASRRASIRSLALPGHPHAAAVLSPGRSAEERAVPGFVAWMRKVRFRGMDLGTELRH